TSVQTDPPDVAAHDLDDHAAVVGLCGGAQSVDRLGGDGLGGVEAEGVVRVAQIVVDGPGHSDDVEALLVDQPRGTGQGALTADGDEGIDAVGGHDLTHPVGPTILIGVCAGSAEDGSSATGQTADIEQRHVEHVVLKQTPPPVADPDEGRPVRAHALADDAADDSIESRAVAARGEYTDLHSSCP